MRKLLKAAALVALLALPCSAVFGQGIPYHDIALSAQGLPLGGVSISVCTPGLVTTGAQAIAGVAILTFGSNPQTAGFVVGASLRVSGFTGADTYFNGTFTIAQTSSSTITYSLNHANGTASSNGTAFQIGSASIPCAPLTSIFSDVGLTQAITQPFLTDGLGNWAFFAAAGPYNAVLAGATITLKVVPIALPASTANLNTWTAPQSFAQQIISTVGTGTAPFSIASTTVVSNLNVQLHNGLTAPASAIVGISDTQTLTAKTLTAPTITNPTITGGGSWAGSPAITTPTIDGFAAGHVALQVSSPTNYGVALTSQTIISSMPATGNVSLLLMPVQVTAGVGCSAATNSVTVNPVTWTAPGGTVENINPSSNMGFVGNGVVDQGASTFGSSGFTNNGIQAIVAKSGTSVSYTTTSTLASTGCSTVPQYVIYAKAIF